MLYIVKGEKAAKVSFRQDIALKTKIANIRICYYCFP